MKRLKRKMDSERVPRQRVPKLFEINKVILIGCMIGLLATVYERNTGIGQLGSNLDTVWHLEVEGFRNDLLAMTKALLVIVILIKAFTKEIYVACYVVMVYAYSGGSKRVTLPWLILCGIRSIILETISCFAGCVICAHYRQLKFPCVDFVITKAVCLACSTFLWSIVYETYKKESRNPIRQRRETAPALTNRERSLDSVLAEAIVDWFLEEAERCQRFDSKLAVDQDIVKFEDELADRAAKFLELTPEEILREAKLKSERVHPFTRKHCSTQTQESKTDISRESVELDLNIERIERNQSDTESVTSITRLSPRSNQSQRISSLDMENKNPLRRFAYFPHIVESESTNEIVGDITVGNKSTSVQTTDEKTEEDNKDHNGASLL